MIEKLFKNTANLMLSKDYKERFIAEYIQLSYRYEKLSNMVTKWDKGQLEFTPTCPRDIYIKQLRYMRKYMKILLERAKLEDIDLNLGKSFRESCLNM